jgi:hypothetical protein
MCQDSTNTSETKQRAWQFTRTARFEAIYVSCPAVVWLTGLCWFNTNGSSALLMPLGAALVEAADLLTLPTTAGIPLTKDDVLLPLCFMRTFCVSAASDGTPVLVTLPQLQGLCVASSR